jgi:hypothetical protein
MTWLHYFPLRFHPESTTLSEGPPLVARWFVFKSEPISSNLSNLTFMAGNGIHLAIPAVEYQRHSQHNRL